MSGALCKCKDSSERCKQCHCHLDGSKSTWEFDGEGKSVKKITVFTLEVVLIVTDIEAVSVPTDICITPLVLFSLACFSE